VIKNKDQEECSEKESKDPVPLLLRNKFLKPAPLYKGEIGLAWILAKEVWLNSQGPLKMDAGALKNMLDTYMALLPKMEWNMKSTLNNNTAAARREAVDMLEVEETIRKVPRLILGNRERTHLLGLLRGVVEELEAKGRGCECHPVVGPDTSDAEGIELFVRAHLQHTGQLESMWLLLSDGRNRMLEAVEKIALDTGEETRIVGTMLHGWKEEEYAYVLLVIRGDDGLMVFYPHEGGEKVMEDRLLGEVSRALIKCSMDARRESTKLLNFSPLCIRHGPSSSPGLNIGTALSVALCVGQALEEMATTVSGPHTNMDQIYNRLQNLQTRPGVTQGAVDHVVKTLPEGGGVCGAQCEMCDAVLGPCRAKT
jgi:hypothetical protein